ncbi:protein of unknown function [Chryseobacterium sp. JV274]|nr:protein of unknown function [Chryseobacterium sp. JV274]
MFWRQTNPYFFDRYFDTSSYHAAGPKSRSDTLFICVIES